MRAWHQQTLAAVLIVLMLGVSAKSVEMFRYRYNGEDGAEYEAVFETDEQSVARSWPKRGRYDSKIGIERRNPRLMSSCSCFSFQSVFFHQMPVMETYILPDTHFSQGQGHMVMLSSPFYVCKGA